MGLDAEPSRNGPLGEREGGTARLEEAVKTFRAALERQTCERAPFAWAQTQNNLGDALLALGGSQNSRDRLKEAFDALQGSLEVYQKTGMTQRATDLAKKLAAVRTRIAAAQGR